MVIAIPWTTKRAIQFMTIYSLAMTAMCVCLYAITSGIIALASPQLAAGCGVLRGTNDLRGPQNGAVNVTTGIRPVRGVNSPDNDREGSETFGPLTDR